MSSCFIRLYETRKQSSRQDNFALAGYSKVGEGKVSHQSKQAAERTGEFLRFILAVTNPTWGRINTFSYIAPHFRFGLRISSCNRGPPDRLPKRHPGAPAPLFVEQAKNFRTGVLGREQASEACAARAKGLPPSTMAPRSPDTQSRRAASSFFYLPTRIFLFPSLRPELASTLSDGTPGVFVGACDLPIPLDVPI